MTRIAAVSGLLVLALGVMATGCGSAQPDEKGQTATSEDVTISTSASTDTALQSTSSPLYGDTGASPEAEDSPAILATEAMLVTYDNEDLDDTWDEATAVNIALLGDTAEVLGSGVEVRGAAVTITAGGTYLLTGTLEDGQIVIDTQDKKTVRLVLNGADVSCSTSAPIYVANANKTIITLTDDSQNRVADGGAYTFSDAESNWPDATIFSKDDLIINGGGSLAVQANYKNGIASNDDLKIVSGDIVVEAVNDGIRGRDSLGIRDGNITITAGGDGMQSSNDADPAKGYISIQGGAIVITAREDGIQAETTLAVRGGDFTISTGGGSTSGGTHADTGWDQDAGPSRAMDSTTEAESTDTSTSAKGLKAGTGIFIFDGVLAVDSADDAVNSNGSVEIQGGDLSLASGDDGIHADASVEIAGGQIDITASYEGIESVKTTVRDGIVHLVSSDDGINGISNADNTETAAAAGPGPAAEGGNAQLVINGGYLAIDAGGDGLDINGAIQMTAGTVLINGPTKDGNGALDYYGAFEVTGGLLVAAGSAGMAEAPSAGSTQCSIMVNFDQAQQADTIVHIEGQNGTEVLTFSPSKQYQSIVVSSADIQQGSTYAVFVGGSSTGEEADSLYSNGTYSPGTEYVSLTVSSTTTISGQTGMGGGGGMPGGLPGGGPSGRPGG